MTDTIQLTKTIFSKRVWSLNKDFSHSQKTLLKQEKDNDSNIFEKAMEDYRNWVNICTMDDFMELMKKRWIIL